MKLGNGFQDALSSRRHGAPLLSMADVLEIDPFDPRVDKRKLQYASIIQEPRHFLMLLISVIAMLECIVKVAVALSLIERDPTLEKNSFKWSASTAIGFFTFLSLILSLYLFSFPGGTDKIKDDLSFSQRMTSVTFLQAIFNVLTKLISSILMGLNTTRDPVIPSLSAIRPVAPVILLTTVFCCDVLFLVIHENYEVSGYNPLMNSKNYERVEINEENDGSLALVSSEAFRIVLRNISNVTWLEPQLQVYRHTSDTSGRHKNYRLVQFAVDLEKEVLPGEQLVLVPEPVYEEGAVEVLGYRGFGGTAEQVFTTVKLPGSEEVLTKLTEIYRKKKNDRIIDE